MVGCLNINLLILIIVNFHIVDWKNNPNLALDLFIYLVALICALFGMKRQQQVGSAALLSH